MATTPSSSSLLASLAEWFTFAEDGFSEVQLNDPMLHVHMLSTTIHLT